MKYPSIREVIDNLDELDELPVEENELSLLLKQQKHSRISDWWFYIDYYRLELGDWLRVYLSSLTLLVLGGIVWVVFFSNTATLAGWSSWALLSVGGVLIYWGIVSATLTFKDK